MNRRLPGSVALLAATCLLAACQRATVLPPRVPSPDAEALHARALDARRALGESLVTVQGAGGTARADLRLQDPEGLTAALAGRWRVRSRLHLRRGGDLLQPDFDLASWSLLGGQLVLEHWLAGQGPHASQGLVLRGTVLEGRGRPSFALDVWLGAEDVGWRWLVGDLQAERLSWAVTERDALGLRRQTRQDLTDVTSTSWRLLEGHSYDGGSSWQPHWRRDAVRLAAELSGGNGHWSDAFARRSAAFAVSAGPPAARPQAAVPLSLSGHWAGTAERQGPDGSWVAVPCEWRVQVAPEEDAFVAEYREAPAAAGSALERVSVGVALTGRGRRADGRPWELVRVDDRTGQPYAFAGGVGDGEVLEHVDRHGVPLARRVWHLDPGDSDTLGWTESSSSDGGQHWTPRVRVRLDRVLTGP